MKTIDLMFHINTREIDELHNKNVKYSFEAMRNIIRISFLSCLVYLYYFIVTFINNKRSDFCKGSIMCLGYLSFVSAPENASNILTFSHIVNIIVLFTYVLNLFVRFFLNNTGSDYFKEKFKRTKLIFSSPSLKLMTLSQSRYNIAMIYNNIMNSLYNKVIIWNIIVSFLVLCLVLLGMSGSMLSIFIFVFIDDSTMSYVMKMFIIALCLSVIVNISFLLSHIAVGYYKNISLHTFFFIKFWIPFITKFSCYVLILSTNMNIFLGIEGGFFFNNFTVKFYENEFQCREDQTAFNLIFFLCVEFLLRKIIFAIFIIFKPSTVKVTFDTENIITHTICQYFLLSNIQLVFPIAAVFTVLISIIDYHIEMFFTKYFHMIYNTDEYIDNFNEYIIFSLFATLFCNIIFSIIVMNQHTIMNNDVANDDLPLLCRHRDINDDYSVIFRKSFDIDTMELYECCELFLMVPAVIGLIILIGFGKGLFRKRNNSMKVILTANEDMKWEEIAKKVNVILKKEEMLKKVYEKGIKKMKKNLEEDKKKEKIKQYRRKAIV